MQASLPGRRLKGRPPCHHFHFATPVPAASRPKSTSYRTYCETDHSENDSVERCHLLSTGVHLALCWRSLAPATHWAARTTGWWSPSLAPLPGPRGADCRHEEPGVGARTAISSDRPPKELRTSEDERSFAHPPACQQPPHRVGLLGVSEGECHDCRDSRSEVGIGGICCAFYCACPCNQLFFGGNWVGVRILSGPFIIPVHFVQRLTGECFVSRNAGIEDPTAAPEPRRYC